MSQIFWGLHIRKPYVQKFNLVHQSLECGELITVDVRCLENADQQTTMQKVGWKLHVAEIDTAHVAAT